MGVENEFEIAGRLAKAKSLSLAAQERGMVRMDLEMMCQEEWLMLSESAGVKPPSLKSQRVAIALTPRVEVGV